MLAKRIIPCLDVDDGRVKKGVNFVNLRDVGDPVEIAKMYEKQGADELVFLDISATNQQRKTISEVISAVSQEVFMPLTVGGGITNITDMAKILAAGADKISINSAAVSNPNLISDGAKRFGSQAIVVAIDVSWDTNQNKYFVYTHGGKKKTELEALSWAKQAVNLGAGELLVTSMDKDGTKKGFDLSLYEQLTKMINVPVIASGGAGNINDFKQLFKETNVSGALAASVFHFKTISIPELKVELRNDGVEVR